LKDRRLGRSPLQDDEVRRNLQRAILDNDPATFRKVLHAAYPALSNEHRLYGVLRMTPTGMESILVDEMGGRIGPEYVIAAETPMELLNVHYGESEMTVTTEDGVWKAPYEKRG
jgi:hypothetical protein